MKHTIKIISGFLLLFVCYHLAEYFVLFQNKPLLFLLFQFAFFSAAWFLARRQGFSGFAAWGLDTQKKWWNHLVVGMLTGVALYGISFTVSLITESEKVITIPAAKEIFTRLTLFCFGVFFSSLSEDILTRGYLFRHFGKRMPSEFFVLLSASIYLLNHIYRLMDGWETFSYLFLLGVLFAIPLVMTKKLWFTGGMHWMGNTVFYFTHGILQTESITGKISANILFIFCILFFIPVIILLIRRNPVLFNEPENIVLRTLNNKEEIRKNSL